MMLRLVVVAVCCAALACGDDSSPPPPIFDAGPDAGPIDAGPPFDGGPVPDTGPVPMVDSGPAPDGGPAPEACPGGLTSELFELGTDDQADPRMVAVAAGPNGHVVAWAQSVFARTFKVFTQLIPPSGDPGAPVQLVDGEFGPAQRGVSLVRSGSGFVVAWDELAEAEGDTRQIWTQQLDANGSPVGAPRTISAGPNIHDSVHLAARDTGIVAGYIDDDTLGSRIVHVQALGADGASAGAPVPYAGSEVTFSLPRVASRGPAGAVLLWANVAPGETLGEVQLQPLLPSLMTDGSTEVVNGGGEARGSIDTAVGVDGAIGVTYDINLGGGGRTDVRFRLVDPSTGRPSGVMEQVLTRGDLQGTFPGVTPFSGGWAVVYRAQELGVPTTLRMALLASFGDLIATADLGGDPVAEDGGNVSVDTGSDGTIVAAWAEAAAGGGTLIQARRIRCE